MFRLRRLRQVAWIDLGLRTAIAWREDGVPRLAAALSYYTVFSLAPLLVIVLGLLGMAVERTWIQDHLLTEVRQLLGDKAAMVIGELVDNASGPGRGLVSTLVGVAMLVFGASGVFVELKGSLNLIWRVRREPGGGLAALARTYFAPLTMILGIGFLLLVSLMLSAGMAALGSYIGERLPSIVAILHATDNLVAFAMVTVLFALIYKVLPDTKLSWHEVWLGAGVAGALFTVGRTLIGLYLGRASVTSSYGAAGSLVVILAWVYYSAQILLIGAEFSRVRQERLRAAPAIPRQVQNAEAGGATPCPLQ